ncbi:hypothetical protein [Absidia glauca]|uniref:Uncharacterized protein n=1 Tax=Absidia glauca TaxID=4829 RepID=A0A163J8D4_ABSGL|nr:hypothetical protein [Absidia glauca]
MITMPYLNYDILLDIVPYLDSDSLVSYALVCRSLCNPALRCLWNCPLISTTTQLRLFCRTLTSGSLRPYQQWIIRLTIAFSTFHPMDDVLLFQSIISHELPNLSHLSLRHTYAVFSPILKHYEIDRCVLDLPTQRSNDHPLFSSWLELNFGSTSLPLTHMSIHHTPLNNDVLCGIARRCPRLQQVHLSGLFSDQGVITMADSCSELQEVSLNLPDNLVQSNTITHAAIDRLAVSCPALEKLTILGQIRINHQMAEQTLRRHCKRFTYCDFGPDP